MCKWNKDCVYKSDEMCHECDYNYIQTEEEYLEYFEYGLNLTKKRRD